MKPRATPARDPRQRAGLTLATPRRVRLDVDPNDWRRLSDLDVRRACRPLRGVVLAWEALGDDPLAPRGWRSSPIDQDASARVRTALADRLGLDTTLVEGLTWPHLALVRYVDGTTVAFGCSEAPRDATAAELGVPVAWIDRGAVSDRVRPWQGLVHGHTDAEVRRAPSFARGGRWTAAMGAAS